VAKRLSGEGLVTSEGEYHDRQRGLIQPTFHPNRIKGYGGIITSHAIRMCERRKDGIVLDIHKEMMLVTLEIIRMAVLGLILSQKRMKLASHCKLA
jgi:cytochrome P450